MGALVLLLVWIYYASVVFFVGALITAVIDERLHVRQRLSPAQDARTAGPLPPSDGISTSARSPD